MRARVTLRICYHGGYWGMVHRFQCIWNSQAKFFLNHCWYVVLLKTVINFSVMINCQNIENVTKISLNWYYLLIWVSCWFWRGGMCAKIKQCKQTTGPKSVLPGAEMHRTGGRNPSYHVIMVNIMAADAPAPYFARSSAVMILTV